MKKTIALIAAIVTLTSGTSVSAHSQEYRAQYHQHKFHIYDVKPDKDGQYSAEMSEYDSWTKHMSRDHDMKVLNTFSQACSIKNGSFTCYMWLEKK